MHYSEVFVDYGGAMAFLFWLKKQGVNPKPLRQKPYSRRFVINSAGGYAVSNPVLLQRWCESSPTAKPYKERVALAARVLLLAEREE